MKEVFIYYNISNRGKLWSPLAPSVGEIGICQRGLFSLKKFEYYLLANIFRKNLKKFFENQEGILKKYNKILKRLSNNFGGNLISLSGQI